VTSAVQMLVLGGALLADIPVAFRTAFEQRFRPGQTYAVVLKAWIPAAAVSDTHPDAIDVVKGGWRRSTGFGDPGTGGGDITAYLGLGEVLELVSLHYKDDRIDLVFRSVDLHEVVKKEKRRTAQVATRFKFFFPFSVLGSDDVAKAVAYIEPYLRDFPSLGDAQAFSDNLARPTPTSSPTPLAPKVIELGQTPEQVKAVLGQPERLVDLGAKLIYYYPDMVITFMNGRLTDVQQK